MYSCSDCFANKASFSDKGCVALVEKPKGDHCPFKKTRTQYDFDRKKAGRRLKKMYQNAMPYMEKYRALMPDAAQKWGPALYRIYFNLNMGKQFDEIDKILKKQKS